MKIVGILTHYLYQEGEKPKEAAVDWWRVRNPLNLLKKHGHEVKFYEKIVFEQDEKLPPIDWEGVDIVMTSYLDDPQTYSYLRAIGEEYGVRHIMDIDDNMLDIQEFNPARLRYFKGGEPLENVLRIISDVDVLTTTTEYLKDIYQPLRPNKPIYILPNYIDPETYKANEKDIPDNGEKIIIGYFGSATHWHDFFETGKIGRAHV